VYRSVGLAVDAVGPVDWYEVVEHFANKAERFSAALLMSDGRVGATMVVQIVRSAG
jgi:hypothetical protein